MNDDFEPDEDDVDPDSMDDGSDDFREAKDKGKEAWDKYKEQKGKNTNNQNTSNNDPTNHNQAKEFNKSQNAQNQARAQNPDAAKAAGNAAKTSGEAAKTGGQVANNATGTSAAAGGATADGAAAGGATAGGAAAGGAVAAQAAIPVVGWIALAVEAVIALAIGIRKAIKKHDAKMAENGVDTKSIRKLIMASPILLPICIFFLIIVIIAVFMQAETSDRVEFMQRAITCFETNGSGTGCADFMNTGIHMGWNAGTKPLIKKTDIEIAEFVVDYISAENKVYKNTSSGFSLNETLDSIANQEYLDQDTPLEKIENYFKELVANSFIGDIQEAWYLFRWMKMEKKIFNQIDWLEASINPSGNISWWNNLQTNTRIKLGKNPMEELSKATKEHESAWYEISGFHWDTAWLKVPIGNYITLDEAIDLTKEYIPSFIEVYATYVASGSYKIADKVYDYYIENTKPGKPLELKVKSYEINVVDVEEYSGEHVEKTYYRVVNDTAHKITEQQYNDLKKQVENKSGIWAWLKSLWDKVVAMFDEIGEALEDAWDWILDKIGWYIKVEQEYVNVVEKGAAYQYKVKNEYKLGVEEYNVTAPKNRVETKEEETSAYDLTFEEKDSDGEVIKTTKEKMSLKIKITTTYDEIHKICQNTLVPRSGNTIEKYEEGSRYEWVLAQIGYDSREAVKNGTSDEAYSEADAALALDVIESYYAQTFGLIGGATSSDFVPAGTLNESIVKYASQFNGRKLNEMKLIDNLDIFSDNHWCAMFVSFCMKKADVPVPVFYGCSTFWAKYKSKPGFFDVRGARNGGYITSDSSHIANLNQIQPGDIILFRWDSAGAGVARSHTGICQSIEKDHLGAVQKITVIEGNVGGTGYFNSKVAIREYTGYGLGNIVSFVSVSTVKSRGGW